MLVAIGTSFSSSERNDPIIGPFASNIQPRRYEFCLHFSPFICLADAVSSSLSILEIRSKLDISYLKAVRIVNVWRHSAGENDSSCRLQALPLNHCWLRQLLFIINTALTAVKILSLSGIPWPRAWGSMFITSYMFLESINLNFRTGSEQAVIATSTVRDWPRSASEIRANDHVRHQIRVAHPTLKTMRYSFLVATVISQVMLNMWAMQDLTQLAIEQDVRTPPFLRVVFRLIFMSIVVLHYASTILRDLEPLSMRAVRWGGSNPTFITYVPEAGLAICIMAAVMAPLGTKIEDRYFDGHHSGCIALGSIFCFGYGVAWVMNTILTRIFPILPSAGRALFLVAPFREVKNEVSKQLRKRNQKTLDEKAMCLTWFSFHYILGVLWYALGYDPAGTVNYDWTGLLGQGL